MYVVPAVCCYHGNPAYNLWFLFYQLSSFQLKTFYNFRLWKGFKLWQKTVQWKKLKEAKNYLEKNLLILMPTLAQCIIRMRERHHRFENMDFVRDSCPVGLNPASFVEVLVARFQTIGGEIQAFRRDVCEILCENWLN